MTQKKTIVALGYFDCLHRGHRKLIETCQRIAAENGAIPAVFTFAAGKQYPFKEQFFKEGAEK